MKQHRNRNRIIRKSISLLIIGSMMLLMLGGCVASEKAYQGKPLEASLLKEKAVAGSLSGLRITYDELQIQIEAAEVQAVLQQYQTYADANPDYVGWLYLKDTMVNGPVVQSQLDGDGYWEYLYKDFYGNDQFAGTLFLDKACSIGESPTDNWIIYGHNMNNGSMFGTLKYYRNPEFWEEHPTFCFVTRDSIVTFEILGVVQSWVSDVPEGQFEYYFFFDAADETEFNAFVQQVKSNALYETEVEAEYGDQLITLSTCDGWHTEGRLAIIGRRISEKKGL